MHYICNNNNVETKTKNRNPRCGQDKGSLDHMIEVALLTHTYESVYYNQSHNHHSPANTKFSNH